jgi:lipopolysaccharide export system permease protein
MNILSRYVVRAVLAYTGLVMAVLLGLISLYIFITQQDEIGIGHYDVGDALVFTVLNLPQYAFDLLPIAALIGALFGLGNLARSLELVVMRASGLSVFRIAGWVAIAGLVIAACMWLIGEYVAPPLEHYARQQKMILKFNQFGLAGTRSIWAKDGETIVSVQQQSADNEFGGVLVFKLDPQHRLRSAGRANMASIGADGRWRLDGYQESDLGGDGGQITTRRVQEAELDTHLSPEFLGFAVVSPNSLPAAGLYSYMQHLRANDLDATLYETAFWSRIARTIAAVIIVMLALPFVFGPMRSTGMGARMVIGILIGAGFFFLAEVLESGGRVFGLPPYAIAWGPTALLAVITTAAIARVR